MGLLGFFELVGWLLLCSLLVVWLYCLVLFGDCFAWFCLVGFMCCELWVGGLLRVGII